MFRDSFYEVERRLLERMNKVGIHAVITTEKAAGILERSESAARTVLSSLVKKGYLIIDTSGSPFIYSLQQHYPDQILTIKAGCYDEHPAYLFAAFGDYLEENHNIIK